MGVGDVLLQVAVGTADEGGEGFDGAVEGLVRTAVKAVAFRITDDHPQEMAPVVIDIFYELVEQMRGHAGIVLIRARFAGSVRYPF